VEVPVTSSDELGELARAFNLMVRDLRERDRLQATFSTYLDKEIARIVMEDAIPEHGFEVEASILFCDVKGFTSFAESADPADVVARLNQVLALAVPIVEEHGGYVDKFIGDGLLAVFGAPGELPDHADRAVSAAERITAAVRASGSELEMVAGVNTGRVVAGVVGAAGRLSFSVIGDTVNVAARVEAATRDTGDRVLITAATRAALARPLELKARGSVVLKGKAKPVELFAIP
jgi:adenylate cyclase